ncbi:MAG: hypothetical protein Q8M40_04015 [Legionella sp.]|nr:hypothetical protein [Legionella sp.]
MTHTLVINPALEKNIDLVVKIMHFLFEDRSGHAAAYDLISLIENGQEVCYAFTLPVMQFIPNQKNSDSLSKRLDVYEPYIEAKGSFGSILPVITSIIIKDGKACMDSSASYVIKKIEADQQLPTDKPNKPNYYLRSAQREHYLASQIPHLGVNYQLISEPKYSYIHMNRMPGHRADYFIDSLSGAQYLSLACAFLEKGLHQIHQRVKDGKHKDKIILHCDISIYNFMVNKISDLDWEVKVIDFGLSKTVDVKNNLAFSTKHGRGNFAACDRVTLQSRLHGHPLTYSRDSDIYALFVVILQLGGLLIPNTHQKLLNFLNSPNLNHLFKKMNFPSSIHSTLTELAQKMLEADKDKRVSLEDALIIFKNAREEMSSFNQTDQTHSLPPLILQETVGDLRDHLQAYIHIDKEKLRAWIIKYIRLKASVSINDAEFKSLSMHSEYVKNYFRFNLDGQYNAESSTRLLFRHQALIRPLQKSYRLSHEWSERFNQLVEELPMQLTREDEQYMIQLALYKSNISKILFPDTLKDNEIASYFKDLLQQHLSMSHDEWMLHLPEQSKQFNNKFQYLTLLQDIKQDFLSQSEIQPKMKPKNEEWLNIAIHDLFVTTLTDAHMKHVAILHNITSKLKQLPTYSSSRLFVFFDEVNQCPYSMRAINKQSDDLSFEDLNELSAFSDRLNSLFKIIHINATLNDSTNIFSELEELNEEYFELFSKILLNYINDESALTDKIQKLSNQLANIEELNKIIKEIKVKKAYELIENSLIKLMSHPEMVKELLTLFKIKTLKWAYLYKLNTGLEAIPVSPPEDYDNRLMAEIKTYFSQPERYRTITPQSSQIHRFLSPLPERPKTETEVKINLKSF